MATTTAMSDIQREMIESIQELGLTLDDLRQYLDTHLHDQFAISRFNSTREDLDNLLSEYSRQYGPLTGACPNIKDENNWLWAMQAFPWDYE
ncbi:MAG: spore coat protein CotJB [Firmicutes bacterium]|nr:spore coat protein CotJB [Bacillota bacterium]